MYLNKMISIPNRKILVSVLILSSLLVGSFAFAPHSFAATKPATTIKVVGKAKFVLQGTVTAVAIDSLTLHVTNTSKNAKLFDSKDKTITVSKNTKITKNGGIIYLKDIKKNDTVKVFGIFDKKTGLITLIRWIKVVPK